MTISNTTRLSNSLEKVVEEGSVSGNGNVTSGLISVVVVAESTIRHGTSQKLRRKMSPKRKEI